MKESQNGFFNTKTLAERWLCSEGTICNYAKSGLIHYFKTPGGREYLFPKNAIYEYEQKQLSSRKEVKRQLKKNRIPLTTLKKEWRVE